MKISAVIPNYNHSEHVSKCIDALLGQRISNENEFNVIVVDDGSTDGSAETIQQRYGNQITLLRLPENRGRSTARNYGAQHANADYILFVDSDCIATDYGFIQAYIDIIRKNNNLIFGQVSTHGNGFWALLQNASFKKRQHDFNTGQLWAYTTQNVCVSRKLFIEVNGFDLAFDRHGFEDRDLFIRMIEMGAVPAYCAAANVIHDDRISLRSVSGKMLAAGRHSSISFGQRHPAHYALSTYAKLDCRIHPWLKWLNLLTWPIVKHIGNSDAIWLECKKIPLSFRINIARLIYGSHYLNGTVLANSDKQYH